MDVIHLLAMLARLSHTCQHLTVTAADVASVCTLDQSGGDRPACRKSAGYAHCDYGATARLPNSVAKGACSIARVPATSMSATRFQQKYLGKRPVLLTNASSVRRDPSLSSIWERSNMARGQEDVTYIHAPGRPRGIEKNTTISSFVKQQLLGCGDEDLWTRMANGDLSRAPYVFSEVDYSDKEIVPSLQLPWSLPQVASELTGLLAKQVAYICLGNPSSGLTPHLHGSHAWSELIFGRKAWYLQKPECTPDTSFSTMVQQLQDEATIIERRFTAVARSNCSALYECVQGPGDVLYLPPGWLHGTLNLDETVGAVSHWMPTKDWEKIQQDSL